MTVYYASPIGALICHRCVGLLRHRPRWRHVGPTEWREYAKFIVLESDDSQGPWTPRGWLYRPSRRDAGNNIMVHFEGIPTRPVNLLS